LKAREVERRQRSEREKVEGEGVRKCAFGEKEVFDGGLAIRARRCREGFGAVR
jgi:hypothetical protein